MFIFLAILIVTVAVFVMEAARDIGKNLKICNMALRTYFTSLEQYNEHVNHKDGKFYAYLRTNSLLRAVDSIVRMIEAKKKNFKKRSSSSAKDDFPLNMIDESFQERTGWRDIETL